ncbi:alanine racemase [Patescibacteria group bacterium]
MTKVKLIQFLRKLKRKIYYHNPLIRVLVYKNNLLHNLHEYQNKFPNYKIAPVLKSNAYGHGLIEVAKILKNENVPFLVIDSLFEARALRSTGIKNDLLIIGYAQPEEIIKNKLKNVSFVITSLEQLQELAGSLASLGMTLKKKVHLKIDTGMHRQGILVSKIDQAIEIIKKSQNLKLEGICSHLADADSENSDFTEKQIEVWNNVVEKIKSKFNFIKYFHISASAGSAFLEKANCNLVRLGIGLYGFNLSPHIDLNLKPVLEVRTIITGIKKIKARDSVGYNATFTADKDMTVATLPVGYFEGIPRRLSNKGFVKTRNNFCKILGRVSMNITSIDLSEIPDVKTGNEVVVISSDSSDKNSVENNAKICNTIPYEILVDIPQHLKRIVK